MVEVKCTGSVAYSSGVILLSIYCTHLYLGSCSFSLYNYSATDTYLDIILNTDLTAELLIWFVIKQNKMILRF